MPAMPAGVEDGHPARPLQARAGRRAPADWPRVHLFGSGAILREALARAAAARRARRRRRRVERHQLHRAAPRRARLRALEPAAPRRAPRASRTSTRLPRRRAVAGRRRERLHEDRRRPDRALRPRRPPCRSAPTASAAATRATRCAASSRSTRASIAVAALAELARRGIVVAADAASPRRSAPTSTSIRRRADPADALTERSLPASLRPSKLVDRSPTAAATAARMWIEPGHARGPLHPPGAAVARPCAGTVGGQRRSGDLPLQALRVRTEDDLRRFIARSAHVHAAGRGHWASPPSIAPAARRSARAATLPPTRSTAASRSAAPG